MEDIEKLKEAAFKLAEIITRSAPPSCINGVMAEAIAAIEAFKPKVEPLECWVNLFTDGQLSGPWVTKDKAESQSYINQIDRLAVHLREVTPVEWEQWIGNVHEIRCGHISIGYAQNSAHADCIATYHNDAMQRVTGTEGK